MNLLLIHPSKNVLLAVAWECHFTWQIHFTSSKGPTLIATASSYPPKFHFKISYMATFQCENYVYATVQKSGPMISVGSIFLVPLEEKGWAAIPTPPLIVNCGSVTSLSLSFICKMSHLAGLHSFSHSTNICSTREEQGRQGFCPSKQSSVGTGHETESPSSLCRWLCHGAGAGWGNSGAFWVWLWLYIPAALQVQCRECPKLWNCWVMSHQRTGGKVGYQGQLELSLVSGIEWQVPREADSESEVIRKWDYY